MDTTQKTLAQEMGLAGFAVESETIVARKQRLL